MLSWFSISDKEDEFYIYYHNYLHTNYINFMSFEELSKEDMKAIKEKLEREEAQIIAHIEEENRQNMLQKENETVSIPFTIPQSLCSFRFSTLSRPCAK